MAPKSEAKHSQPQGLPNYSFSDADGGPEGKESEVDPDSDQEDVEEHEGAEEYVEGGRGGGLEEEVEVEEGMDESDEEDDTAWRTAATRPRPRPLAMSMRPARCPQRALSATCSAAEKESQQRALCGRRVLAAHILDGATGWYIGTVQNFGVGAAWKQPDATHIVRYQKKETGTKHLEGRVACNLDADNYGQSEWWLLLEPKPK